MLISDWLMPHIDGLELCRLVRAEKRSRYVYIIFITVMEGKNRYLQAMEAGADDFIAKPPDPDELKARLVVAERILELHYEVAQLESLLPICSYCKKIRDEDDTWMPVEDYMARQTGSDFPHGICPQCFETTVKSELAQLKSERRIQGRQNPEGTQE